MEDAGQLPSPMEWDCEEQDVWNAFARIWRDLDRDAPLAKDDHLRNELAVILAATKTLEPKVLVPSMSPAALRGALPYARRTKAREVWLTRTLALREWLARRLR
jgi:hypothetical protein